MLLETYREGLWGYILFPFLPNKCPNCTSRAVCLPLETYGEGYRGNPLPSINLLIFYRAPPQENETENRQEMTSHVTQGVKPRVSLELVVKTVTCINHHVKERHQDAQLSLFYKTSLTTIGKNYNLSFFLACMISLTIASARCSSLGEPQWRESFFSRLCNCCVNSWHVNNRCRFVWQSYSSDWSYTCNKTSKRRGREGCSRC